MSGIKEANGHRPHGVMDSLTPGMASVTRPDPAKLSFNLEATLDAVVSLRSYAPEDAISSTYLGTEREGSAVLIDAESNLLVTIGYLVTECETINLTTRDGRTIAAAPAGYDYETGFGLLRATGPIAAKAIPLGSSAAVKQKDALIVAPRGGGRQAISAMVAEVREFAGYWEYMLDSAIFTVPPHPLWSGAGLINLQGELVGIGSLFVQDAIEGEESVPGNMFVPIDLLKPILEPMSRTGSSGKPPRPWLGLYVVEAAEYVIVSSCFEGAPADSAGLESGDVIIGVDGKEFSGIGALYRSIWALGPAGTQVTLDVIRDGEAFEIVIVSTDRAKFMKQPRAH